MIAKFFDGKKMAGHGLRIVLLSLIILAWNADLILGWLATGLAATCYLLTGGHYTLYLVWHTAPRDMRFAIIISIKNS